MSNIKDKVFVELSYQDFEKLEQLKRFIYGASMMSERGSPSRDTFAYISNELCNCTASFILEGAIKFGLENRDE